MEYLKRFVIWLISGIGLACGVALVSWVINHSHKKDKTLSFLPETLPVDSVHVSSVELVPISESLSASASIVSSEKSKLDVRMQLDLNKDGKVVFSCTRSFTYEDPGKPQHVQIDCASLKRANIPTGATVSVQVKRVEVQTW
jgi:hypothetical protein